MTRSRWLDPSSLRFAVALVLVATVANGIWVFLDNSAPSWDQSHYLWATLQYKGQLAGGPIAVLESIYSVDPDHGPLFTTLLLPILEVFGPSNRSGLLLNLLAAPILFFSAGEIAYIVFRSWKARLLAIVLVATMPLVVGLSHTVLQDFLLVTLATVSLLLLLKTEGFRRRGMSLAMGLAMGLGTLTKVTFPMVMVGPLLVVLAKVVLARRSAARGEEQSPSPPSLRELALNAGGALLVYLLIVVPWYGPNLSETIEYVRSTTSGPLSEGAGPAHPLTFDALTSFTLGVVNFNISWVLVLVGLIAAGLNAGRIRSLFSRPANVQRLLDLAFVLTWVLVPFLVVATAHNQDVRLMATAMPGVAILVAGAVAAVRRRWARAALVAVAVLVPSYQVLSHTTEVDPGIGNPTITVGDRAAVLTLDSTPIGYEKLPDDDFATPVMRYIEDLSSRLPGGDTVTRSICLMQSEAVINTNTFNYLTTARQDPFLPMDVVGWENGEKGLEEWLKGCDFALYTKQPKPNPSDKSRIRLVNEDLAANHMSPKLFRIFKGPGRTFPTSSYEAAGFPEYLGLAGRPDRVRVLVRDRPSP